MPELPEVETLRRGLERHLTGCTVTQTLVVIPKMLKGDWADPAAFDHLLRGTRIENISRRGKHLLFRLDSGYYLLLHLKMRGQLLVVPKEHPVSKYLAAVLTLDNGYELRFHDMWTWGELRLLSEVQFHQHPPLQEMGKEPFSEEWSPQALETSLARHPRSAIKAMLLNQQTVAGIGNIYADEALFRAGIHPTRPAGALSKTEIACLHQEIRTVLTEAIGGGGTASENFLDTQGQMGCYIPKVYDRAGQPCIRCNSSLVRTKVTGRGTTYCPVCQQ